jgi:pyruvate formate lyase activating enzyme
MQVPAYLDELSCCTLCEHRCGVNRLAGERGVCAATLPEVASAMLHPAPPESYTVFLSGCNYRCLGCQNWTLSGHPLNGQPARGWVEPEELAVECLDHLDSPWGQSMGADRVFFSGGEATIHLPYIEEVVRRLRARRPSVRVNFDTNGFLTEQSLERVLSFATSITYDIKAFHDDTHRALTGCPVEAVLRNAERIGREHPEQLWEYRVLVVPGINEEDMEPLLGFVAGIDRELPVAFLAFRPNHVLQSHPGAGRGLLERCVETARSLGLHNVHWCGLPDLPGRGMDPDPDLAHGFSHPGAALATTCARHAGCATVPRDCGGCSLAGDASCPIKPFVPATSS